MPKRNLTNNDGGVPRFATEPTGMAILNQLQETPYDSLERIGGKCFVCAGTVRYNIRRFSRLAGLRGKYLRFQVLDAVRKGEVVFYGRT